MGRQKAVMGEDRQLRAQTPAEIGKFGNEGLQSCTAARDSGGYLKAATVIVRRYRLHRRKGLRRLPWHSA